MNYLILIGYLFFVPTIVESQDYNIVSWNIRDFGQSRTAEEIEMIADVLKDADIVALQEVVGKHPGGIKAVARLVDELNRKGNSWDYAISNPTKSPSAHISERYAFLWKKSKFHVAGGDPLLVSELASSIDREPYMIQLADRKCDKVITLLNYHACTHKKHFPERAEIIRLSNWLVNVPYENVIFMGDMNLVVNDSGFDLLYESNFKNTLNGEKTSLKKKCKNGNYLSRAEDNIFYKIEEFIKIKSGVIDFIKTSDCTDVKWKWISYSDHLPVLLSIRGNN